MNLRIATVDVRNFRGISAATSLDLRSDQGRAVSCILAGDNGTGKSSFVDAIEFVLQGRVGRSDPSGTPELISLAGGNGALISAHFEDGSTCQRDALRTEDGRLSAERTPHAQFAMAPIVLRRQDILRFWDTPELERQVLFADYVRRSALEGWHHPEHDRLVDLDQERKALNQRKAELLEMLARRLGMAPREIPVDSNEYGVFVKDHVYGGMTSDQRYRARNSGIRLQFDEDLESVANELRATQLRIGAVRKEIRLLRQPAEAAHVREELKQLLARVASRLTNSFLQISSSRRFVKQITLSAGDYSDASLSCRAVLNNGNEADPRRLFSEANLDLIALLIFLAVAKESAATGQAKFLILDDVLQSVDAVIRLRTMEFILQEFPDWQLLFTVHDRLWQEQLSQLLSRSNHDFVQREIIRWEFGSGPVVADASLGSDPGLSAALSTGDVGYICSQAGLLLERLCNRLSYTLPISVTRRKGDKYTLGDVWPGILKVLKKTTAGYIVVELDRWIHLRNLVGAHYNEWANSLSREEAYQFGEAVLLLNCTVTCTNCHRFIDQVTSGGVPSGVWTCRCGLCKVSRSS